MNTCDDSRAAAFSRSSRVLAVAVVAVCATAAAGCGSGGKKDPMSAPSADKTIDAYRFNKYRHDKHNKPIKPTTSPTPAPPIALHPQPQKAASGSESAQSPWPSLQTAGVPTGTTLKKSGPITVRKNGTVIDGLEVQEEINIEANNVTIRNTHVIGRGQWSIFQREGFSGLRVENSEVNGDGQHQAQFGILNYGGMLTVKNTYLHTISNGILTDQGLIEDSIIKQPKLFPNDHIDLIQTSGGAKSGTSLVIRHNVLLNQVGQTSAVALFQDFGRVHDVTIDNNFLAGGGYTLYAGKGRFGTSSNIKITRNAFSRKFFKNSGQFGPVTAYEKGPGNEWSANVWAETGEPLLP
jgi:hypothetical protein